MPIAAMRCRGCLCWIILSSGCELLSSSCCSLSCSASQLVSSGVCISPQSSWAPYCQPAYQVTGLTNFRLRAHDCLQVYALYESARTDVNYWLQLDKQAGETRLSDPHADNGRPKLRTRSGRAH
eukprot:768340-Hanusia_phi.AAC.6